MPRINAVSSTSAVEDWLANSRHPRILHVFDNACNLINERRAILSTVVSQIGNGPFNLVVDDKVVFSEHLNAESPISIYDTRLKLGGLIINTTNAESWSPRPDWTRLHDYGDIILNRLLSSLTSLYQLQLPASLISDFISALIKQNRSSIKAYAAQLAGLGQGLTPSGDDFMMGAMYAAWIIHPPEVASVLAKEIAEIAAPLTTSLSAAWLGSAARGEAGILWHTFFDALTGHDAMELPITWLLSVGETSGADALAGFFGVMTAFKERIIDRCPS